MKLILFILLLYLSNVNAEEITFNTDIIINNKNVSKLIDNNEKTYININDDIKIVSNEEIYGIYIRYERESKTGILNSNGEKILIGQNNFLHEYVELNKPSKELTIHYDDSVKIAEINVIGEGEIPTFVEKWNAPAKECDLLLFTTHSDDEQLFFLGLLPTYVARGAEVQVVYFTNHYDNSIRLHEQLHGLYVVGIRNYPIIGIVPDEFSKTLDGAIRNMENRGITLDDAINFQIEMLRRFKPQVVVSHDEKGEYEHGQHMLTTYTLKEAIEKSNNKDIHQESYLKYGIWDVPKVYLHLYKNNPITMNYDEKLDYFDGKTAYEMSKNGYLMHSSQQWTWFTKWMNGKNNEYTKATDIKTYSPLEYGLYRTLVGEDKLKNDMFENLILRKDIKDDIKEDIKKEDNNSIINKIENEHDNKRKQISIKKIIISILLLVIIAKLFILIKK